MKPLPFNSISLELPWESSVSADQRFRRWLLIGLILVILFVLVFWQLGKHLPEPEKVEVEKIELVQIELEPIDIPELPKPEPPKPEPPKPKPPEPKPEPPKPKPPEPKPVKPKTKPTPKPVALPKGPEQVVPSEQDRRQAAKEQASQAASVFENSFSELQDTDVDVSGTTLTQGAKTAKQQNAGNINKQANQGSGGIKSKQLSRETGGGVKFASKEGTKVNSKLANQKNRANRPAKTTGQSAQAISSRSAQGIRKTMDGSKGAVFAIYNRALRKNPTLEGRVTVRLVIEPNGKVSSAKIVSSQLGDSALEAKILARIRRINFGTAQVSRTTTNYSINFVPN